jgi:hypothetical protein
LVAERLGVAYPFLTAFARVLGADAHLTAALSGETSRIKLARFYIRRMLPEYAALLKYVREGSSDLTDITPEDLV